MDIGQVIGVWIHTLAFVIAWGYYGVLARIILPGLERSLDRPGQIAALGAIERRALPLVILSLVLFTVTGTYLLLTDPKYAGLGNFFASTWTTLMLIKHVVVIVLVGLAVIVDVLIRRLGDVGDATAQSSSLRRVALAAEGATGLGALIVLLTAAAQAVS